MRGSAKAASQRPRLGILPGSGRPKDAYQRVATMLEDRPRAIAVVALDREGNFDFHSFGKMRKSDLCFLAVCLMDHVMHEA